MLAVFIDLVKSQYVPIHYFIALHTGYLQQRHAHPVDDANVGGNVFFPVHGIITFFPLKM